MFPAASISGQNRTPPSQAKSPASGGPNPRGPVETGGRSGKQRDAFFDNAKYVAIVLVAVAHAWVPLKGDSRVLQALYMVVYTFHMPAFIIISGYFSRSFDARPDRIRRLITGIVVPYVVFETAYAFFKRYADNNPEQEISLLDPWYVTWFLCALFVWRLTTPLWKVVRWPLPIALGIAMLASLSPNIGDDLDLQRVLQFLPFFVLGLGLRPEHFALVRRRSARIASVPVIVAALLTGWWAVPRLDIGWFYHRDSAQELGAPWWVGPVMVLALFGCSLVLTACFFAWVPGRRTWFTALGAGTLYGYLLHGFLTKGADYWGWTEHDWLQNNPLGWLFVSTLAAVAVTLLCTQPVRRVFRCVMEPEMKWAFKQDPVEQARERQQESRRPEREKAGTAEAGS